MSTLFSDLFLKSSTAVIGDRKLFFYNTSGTFTAPYDMDVQLDAIGAGASGGVSTPNSASGVAQATGGGAGGHVRKKISLKAGDVLTITIGAGGAGKTVAVNGTAIVSAGNNGGDTIVTGPSSLNILAGGGKAGQASGSLTAATAGGIGGTASGGDINLAGGRGGNIAAWSLSRTASVRATGGGAVNMGLGAFHGGDNTSTSSTQTSAVQQCTSGAGIGEDGLPVVILSGSDLQAPGGIGAFSNLALPSSRTTPLLLKARSLFGVIDILGPVGAVTADGTVPNPQAGPGAGGGMKYISSTAAHLQDCQGGYFAGGGGAINVYTSNQYAINSGRGGPWGGASGGCASLWAATLTTSSNSGGDGVVILEVLT